MENENNVFKINTLLDVSCVQAFHTLDEIDEMIDLAVKYDVKCVFTLPSFTEYTIKKIKEKTDTGIPVVNTGGVVGFPSGGETTYIKAMQAKELRKLGCDEIDMVMNISALNSDMTEFAANDIRSVISEAGDIPVKVIIEAPSLTEDKIKEAVEICIDSGASYVKTSTGWQEKKTKLQHIEAIKKFAGDRISIKAAGGIRDIETIRTMYNAGCTRFGVNINTAKILLES